MSAIPHPRSLYLVSAVLFILALRGLSSPETSRGAATSFGMAGMALAMLATLVPACA